MNDRSTSQCVILNELMEKNMFNFGVPLLSTRRSALSMCSSDRDKGNVTMQEWILRRKKTQDISCIPDYKSTDVTEPFADPFAREHFPEKINIRMSKPPPGEDDAGISQRFADKKSENVLAFDHSNGEYSEEDGLSESDSFDEQSCVESYGRVSDFSGPDSTIDSSSTDPQIRDFMMNRFLPAAKAMTVDFPSYSYAKQHNFVEPRWQHGKAEGRPPLIHRTSYPTPYHLYEEDVEERDSDESDADVGNMPSRSCGFISRFHRIRSLCLLNPIPGVSPKSIHCKSGKHGRNVDGQMSNPVQGFHHHHIPTSNSNKPCEEKFRFENKTSGYSSSYNSSTCYMDIIKTCSLTPPPSNPPPPSSPFHETEKTDHISSLSMAADEDPTAKSTAMDNPTLQFLPPLPRSPSDSWLSQTLSRKTQSHLNQSRSTPKGYPEGSLHKPATKWETIVKTSYMHSDHTRFSQEITPTAHVPATRR